MDFGMEGNGSSTRGLCFIRAVTRSKGCVCLRGFLYRQKIQLETRFAEFSGCQELMMEFEGMLIECFNGDAWNRYHDLPE